MKPGPRVSLVISFLLAVSTHSNAADVVESGQIWPAAILLEEGLPPADEIGLDNPEPFADLIRSRQTVGDQPKKNLKLDRPPVIVGLPLPEDDRLDEPEYEIRSLNGDVVPEQLDREDPATDSDGMRIALTEWLTCLVEITVPMDRDRSAVEIGEADPMNELRVFGALATAF